jgi:hypothetical protein
MVSGISKVQYVMVIQNLFMQFNNVIISHVILFFESFSHIIHLNFVPWPMIDNLTSCDKIMHSTLVWFHPIEGLLIQIRETSYSMVFMVIYTYNYNVLLGLDFLIKIGAVVDIERGLIHVYQGPGSNVQVLPLNMVNIP